MALDRALRMWPLVACFLICVFVQGITGAWDASFTAYPDEPAHMVGCVLARDFLASQPAAPRPFAEAYYQHYPYFGIGIWPPLFYLLTGAWFLVAGVSRFQALLVVAAMTAGAASVICGLVRRFAGVAAGFSAALLFLSLPEVERWVSAVVADNVVTFFSLAAAACLIRYFDRPGNAGAVAFGLCAAAAILTKYTAWYLCVLPLAALVSLRRFDLLRKRSFWLQHVVIAVPVGLWTLYTASLITRVPGMPLGSIPARAGAFGLAVLGVFPPVLAVAVIGGVLIVACRPGMWKVDVRVLALLGLGQIAFLLIAPPAAVETRYILPIAGVLLVLSFMGWKAAFEPLSRRGAGWAFPVLCLLLSLPFFVLHAGAYRRPPHYNMRPVVNAIVANPAYLGQRILVPADVEGPMIAEFAIADRHRPAYLLRRPYKVLASSNWYGGEYTARFHSAEELSAWLKEGVIKVIVWHRRERGTMLPHEILLGQALSAHPPWLREVAGFDSEAWQIWEYVPQPSAPKF